MRILIHHIMKHLNALDCGIRHTLYIAKEVTNPKTLYTHKESEMMEYDDDEYNEDFDDEPSEIDEEPYDDYNRDGASEIDNDWYEDYDLTLLDTEPLFRHVTTYNNRMRYHA